LTGTPYADVLTGGSGTCIIRGDGGNDVIRAGTGNTVLVGGAGNNTLYGGSGTCLLIAGGSGVSTLYGGSGNSMLIGGSTSYDANDQALLSILSNLAASKMVTSRTRLPVTGSPVTGAYPLTMGKTVKDSGTADTLVEGTGLTWVLPGAHDKVI
jgi:Ca2+-binding RTX toxin-like protein